MRWCTPGSRSASSTRSRRAWDSRRSKSIGACSKKGPPEARRAERAAERVTGVEEPHLIRQLFEAEPVPRRSLGERRGFGDVPWGALDPIVVFLVGQLAHAVLRPIG